MVIQQLHCIWLSLLSCKGCFEFVNALSVDDVEFMNEQYIGAEKWEFYSGLIERTGVKFQAHLSSMCLNAA